MPGFSRVLRVTLILCSRYFLIISLFENLKFLLKILNVVERERRRMTIVLPSKNDKQHITRCSFYVFFGKNNSFSSEKAYSEEKHKIH